MTIKAAIQTLEPGSMVVLYEFDTTPLGGTEILRFHGHYDQFIYWQGEQYSAWPCQAEGFELTGEQQPVPRLRIGNLDGSITQLCMMFEDLVGAKLIRHRTFVQFLDAVNFPGGNPTADPEEEFDPEIWFIERKSIETREWVEFELSSALDFNNVQLPRRQIIANQCPWMYRGPGCAYIGPPVATELDVPTDNPALDKCGRRLASCKLREWPDGVLNFGGFPAAGLARQ